MSGGVGVEALRFSMNAWEPQARGFLRRTLGLPETQTNIEHMELFIVLMVLYVDKNDIHKDLWKQYGWRDSLQHMRSKLMRTQQQVDTGRILSDLDDPMDLIQYTMFCIRNMLDGNEHGTVWQDDEDTAGLITQIANRKGDPVFKAQVMEALR